MVEATSPLARDPGQVSQVVERQTLHRVWGNGGQRLAAFDHPLLNMYKSTACRDESNKLLVDIYILLPSTGRWARGPPAGRAGQGRFRVTHVLNEGIEVLLRVLVKYRHCYTFCRHVSETPTRCLSYQAKICRVIKQRR